ncbi:MAG: ribosome recycling factor [Treponema sp.]|jgi:ribosome recycling factor|nr:ribosome recycling factor [Treponema sp.]
MSDIIPEIEAKMEKAVTALKEGFAALRTGRASASLFDRVRVECYGEKSPLSQVANVSVPQARLIVIQPFDKNLIGEIEKAILGSDLSLNPSNDGKVIRISVPPLTEQRRKDLVKVARNQAEQSRVAVRNIRRDGNDELKRLLKDSLVSEDEEGKSSARLQKLTDACIAKIGQVLQEKEAEIMEV